MLVVYVNTYVHEGKYKKQGNRKRGRGMTYYINPVWFYLIDVCGGLKILCVVVGILALVGTLLYLAYGMDELKGYEGYEEEWGKCSKLSKKLLIIFSFVLALGLFLPKESTCVKMMVSSVITKENVEVATEDVKELVDYVVDKINEVK